MPDYRLGMPRSSWRLKSSAQEATVLGNIVFFLSIFVCTVRNLAIVQRSTEMSLVSFCLFFLVLFYPWMLSFLEIEFRKKSSILKRWRVPVGIFPRAGAGMEQNFSPAVFTGTRVGKIFTRGDGDGELFPVAIPTPTRFVEASSCLYYPCESSGKSPPIAQSDRWERGVDLCGP
jgi:hypothetical protein